MKAEKLYKIIKEDFLPTCMDIMKTKGEAYSGIEDKLGNFKRIANATGLSPEKVLYIYVAKHWDAIGSYIRGEYNDCEPIEGRMMDIVNYMMLLFGLIKEGESINEEKRED